MTTAKTTLCIAVTAALLLGHRAVSHADSGRQGVNLQGVNLQGVNLQGVNLQGVNLQGVNLQGVNLQGVNLQGVNLQGVNLQGTALIGTKTYADGTELTVYHDDHCEQVTNADGSVSASCDTGGLVGGLFTATLDGPELAAPIEVTLRLTAAYVDDSENTLANAADASNQDIYLWHIDLMGDEVDGVRPTIGNICGEPYGRAMFFDGTWDPATGEWSAGGIALACTTGVIAKCARSFGYKPWKLLRDDAGRVHDADQMRDFHESCVRAARADYCATSESFTADGTWVDLYDNYGLNRRVAEDAAHGMFSFEGHFYEPPGDGPSAAAYLLTQRRYPEIETQDNCEPVLYEEYLAAIDELLGDDPSFGDYLIVAFMFGGMLLVENQAWLDADVAYQEGHRHIAVETTTYCPHNTCELGGPMAADCNACTTAVCELRPSCCDAAGEWDQECIDLVKDPNVCGGQQCSDVLTQPLCPHDVCTEGAALTAECNACATTVCDLDPACCGGQWDAHCVELAACNCEGQQMCEFDLPALVCEPESDGYTLDSSLSIVSLDYDSSLLLTSSRLRLTSYETYPEADATISTVDSTDSFADCQQQVCEQYATCCVDWTSKCQSIAESYCPDTVTSVSSLETTETTSSFTIYSTSTYDTRLRTYY